MLPFEGLLAELERLEGAPALSAYLRADGFRGPRPDLAAELATLLKPVRKRLSGRGPETAALEMESKAVVERLPSVAPGRRGVALFSSTRRDLFRWLPLEGPVGPEAHWGERFALQPLRSALGGADRVLVLLAGATRLRLFRVVWGEIEELPDAPERIDGAAEALRRLQESDRIDRLLVGGDAALASSLAGSLPSGTARRLEICGELTAAASATRVLEAALECLWRTRHERDARLVDELLRSAERGRAAVGTAAVTQALAAGDVWRLLVPEGLRLGGGECPSCGVLAPAPAPRFCPACGGPLRAVGDLVERISARVVRGGGSVEEVGGRAAAILAEHEGVGAFLSAPPALGGG